MYKNALNLQLNKSIIRIMKKRSVLIVFMFIVMLGKAQMPPGEYSSTNKKAIASFEKALEYYNSRNDEKAIVELKKALEKDPTFVEPHLLMAQIHTEAKRTQDAIAEYVKALEINPKFDKKTFFLLANLEFSLGKYADAKKDYEDFLKNKIVNPDSRAQAERQLANCNFAIESMKKPVPFEPKNMGSAINSALDEYFPAITADDQTFFYTRNNRTEVVALQEDFLVSKKVNGAWAPSVPLGNGINTSGNEGAPSISADGQLLFFIACEEREGGYGNARKGLGSCDIFYTQKVGNNWSQPYNLGSDVNSVYWETQPSFSADGKTIYFVSNRPGGLGGSDIWYSTLNDKGRWEMPINIGKNINTPGKEESVYIHPDGKTLYFSSDGHVGMGKLDIYVVRKNPEDDEWGTPINLGYPINTYGDENSLLVNGAGNLAYFASNRPGGFGGLDMYQFDLYEAVRPEQITYVKGKVYDIRTKKPLGAHFELIDLGQTVPVPSIVSDANSGNGEFLVTLPTNKNYALNVSYNGYLFYSANFSLKEVADKTKPYAMDVPMVPIDMGSIMELKNVFFETGKYDLKPESKAELDKLVSFLKSNPTLHIELSGHTDNVGDKNKNLVLSQNRAKAVFEYIIANGIDDKRLTYAGYGDTRPKVANDSDENRAANRRTEFKITGK